MLSPSIYGIFMRGRERSCAADICPENAACPQLLFLCHGISLEQLLLTVNNYCDCKWFSYNQKCFCLNLSMSMEMCHMCGFVLLDTLDTVESHWARQFYVRCDLGFTSPFPCAYHVIKYVSGHTNIFCLYSHFTTVSLFIWEVKEGNCWVGCALMCSRDIELCLMDLLGSICSFYVHRLCSCSWCSGDSDPAARRGSWDPVLPRAAGCCSWFCSVAPTLNSKDLD